MTWGEFERDLLLRCFLVFVWPFTFSLTMQISSDEVAYESVYLDELAFPGNKELETFRGMNYQNQEEIIDTAIGKRNSLLTHLKKRIL